MEHKYTLEEWEALGPDHPVKFEIFKVGRTLMSRYYAFNPTGKKADIYYQRMTDKELMDIYDKRMKNKTPVNYM